jgi:four helix bundle protein
MQQYDLEDRLLEYAALVTRLTDQLPNSRTGAHVADQLVRSGTSPYSNHGEAQGAESQKDFIHKMGICIKELRESQRWQKLIDRVPLLKPGNDDLTALLKETGELIRIYATSIKTAKSPL